MKNAFICFSAIMITASVMAQGQDSQIKTQSQTQSQVEPQAEKIYVVMQDGQIWLYKNGKFKMPQVDVFIGDSHVQPDGKVIMKDGTIATLKEGDRVLDDGYIKRATTDVKIKVPEIKTNCNK